MITLNNASALFSHTHLYHLNLILSIFFWFFDFYLKKFSTDNIIFRYFLRIKRELFKNFIIWKLLINWSKKRSKTVFYFHLKKSNYNLTTQKKIKNYLNLVQKKKIFSKFGITLCVLYLFIYYPKGNTWTNYNIITDQHNFFFCYMFQR